MLEGVCIRRALASPAPWPRARGEWPQVLSGKRTFHNDSPDRAHTPNQSTFKPTSYITQFILPHPCGWSFLEPTSNLLVHLLVLMCCSPPLKGEMVGRPQVLFCFVFFNL